MTVTVNPSGTLQLPSEWKKKYVGAIACETDEGILIKKPKKDKKELLRQEAKDALQNGVDESHPLHDSNIDFIEDNTGMRITFKKGVDPRLLIERINDLYGQN